MARQRKSLWQRYESHAIYQVPRRRSKRKPQPTESQIKTFQYLGGLRAAMANRMRLTR
ncbi:NinE family protein [[Erwinia] mediterraneensis]|uniref:NinE family protein n=1 Tax=[Erwinia] mediterraneensis TaxID=2161819 RepID=UPI00102FEF6B|nr:NinE family protein [[Erwinia] mediterraneensis]